MPVMPQQSQEENGPLIRAPYILESESTELQQDTELECQPFFVDLAKLKPDQLHHLRQVGLLPASGQVPRHDDIQVLAPPMQATTPPEHGILDVCLLYDKHHHYLSERSLSVTSSLKSSFVTLDSSRPWMIYWCLHALDLMDRLPKQQKVLSAIVHTLRACWQDIQLNAAQDALTDGTRIDIDIDTDPVLAHTVSRQLQDQQPQSTPLPAGGFGGGPHQMPHLATTYAAVMSLCIVATTKTVVVDTTQASSSSSTCLHTDSPRQLALQLLHDIRVPLYVWLHSLKQPDTGAFRMHHGGEVDVRATYCMVACARILQIGTPSLLDDAVARFVASCQTYEGGFGGEPWSEAHGGYTYCAVAALQLSMMVDGDVDSSTTRLAEMIDLPALRGWLVRRQMTYEGGFQGRSNKLVDGCYSFWQGGALAIVSGHYYGHKTGSHGDGDPWLSSAWSVEREAHDATNHASPSLLFDEGMLQRYILLCAQDVHGGLRDKPSKSRDFYHSCYNLSGLSVSQHCGSMAYGHAFHSRVARTHPCFNIRIERVQEMLERDFGHGTSSLP